MIGRDRVNPGKQKLAVATSLLALAWVVGATMFYRSRGINFAGLLPTVGCLISLWGAFKAESTVMWLGTAVVAASSVLFVFSLGFIVIPATLVLILGSILVPMSVPGRCGGMR